MSLKNIASLQFICVVNFYFILSYYQPEPQFILTPHV